MKFSLTSIRLFGAIALMVGILCPLGGARVASAQRPVPNSGIGRPKFSSDITSAIPSPQSYPNNPKSFGNTSALTGLPVVPLNTLVLSNLSSHTLLTDAIEFNSSMDKLMPCAGCADVNWKAYNQAIKSVKQLRMSLAIEVSNQRTVLAGNPAPEQLANTVRIIQVLERTTSALEAAAKALQYLGTTFDKQR